MATNVSFDGFSLQDSNYIVSEINYRSSPTIDLSYSPVSRESGIKVTSREFAERVITVAGSILGSSATDLQSKIDDVNLNVVRKNEGTLTIDTGRSINAIAKAFEVEDPHYAQDYVPFKLEFLATEPFFSGPQQLVSWTVASGLSSQALSITISGTAYAEPLIMYSANGSSGSTTTAGIVVSYTPTGQYVTWSGLGLTPTLPYGSNVQFDYANKQILQDGSVVNPAGVFSRWEPVSTNFSITYSGVQQGGTLTFSYVPRYL